MSRQLPGVADVPASTLLELQHLHSSQTSSTADTNDLITENDAVMDALKNDKPELTRIDSKAQARIASQVEDYDAMVHDANAVMEREHAMTTWQTIKDHPAAIMWTVLFSLALVMEGYDSEFD